MPELPILLSFVVAAFVVVIVPGVTVSAVVSTALARGLRAALWLELGINLARFSMTLIVALALEAVTGLVAAAFDIIKYAGAAYLIWIGWGYLRSNKSIDMAMSAETTPLRQVISGFVVLWGNPKALIFFGAFLPQFVNPAYPAWPQVIVLGLIEMAAGLVTDTGYAVLAATARQTLKGRGLVVVTRAAGLILIAAAVWLALQHQA